MKSYFKIAEVLSKDNNFSEGKLINLLKDKRLRYIYLLLLKENKCFDYEKLQEIFSVKSKRSIDYSYKRAVESFFVNRDFREEYLRYENKIKKNIH